MIPFITCEIALGQYVCELVFGVNVLDLDLGIQVDSIELPIKSKSVGSIYMSRCRASSLYDHLDHCFVVFKHIQQSFLVRRVDVWGNKINVVQIIDHSMRLLSFLNCVRCWTNFTLVRTQVSPCFITLIRVSNNCDDQIPLIKCGDTIQPQSCIQRNDFWFCWTVRNWSLFLTHQADWNERVASKYAQCSSRSGFRIFKVSPAKSESWNSPSLHCLAVFPTWQYCWNSHVWWMWEIKRDNHLSQALVQFCDRSCKFVNWP